MTLNFVQLIAATRGLEGWPIPYIQQTLFRLGTLKPKLFGLLDFTAGYHQTPLDPASRAYTACIHSGGRPLKMDQSSHGIHGGDPTAFLANVRKVFSRLREFNVAANPKKTKLGLEEAEYVGHVVSSTSTSFTPEKRLKVLNFPRPQSQKGLLQFIGLANYFRDNVPHMTEMCKPLREMIPQRKYKSGGSLLWTPECIEAFENCQQAISNC